MPAQSAPDEGGPCPTPSSVNQSGADRSIVWLASYPKSGNTWLRSLLTAYQYPDDFNINALIGSQDPFSRQALDDFAGITSSEMTEEEIIPYQARWHQHLGREAQAPYFVKTHSIYRRSTGGTPLFPAQASAGVIYITRNPVDIAPSLAHHEGRDLDWAIGKLNDQDLALDFWHDRASTGLTQRMSSWSAHMTSWLDQCEIPIHLVRYEDLHDDGRKALVGVLEFCRLPVDFDKVDHAINRCQINQLQSDEASQGFAEAPSNNRKFFRNGRVGSGSDELTKTQIIQIRQDHHAALERLGYPSTF